MGIISIMSIAEIYLSRKDMDSLSHLIGVISLVPVFIFLYPLSPAYVLFILIAFFSFVSYLHYRYGANYWITIASYSVTFIIFTNFVLDITIALGFGFLMHIYSRFKEMAIIGPESVRKIEDFYSEGLKAFVEKRYHEAIYLLRKALETNPNDKLALNTLGLAYGRVGNEDLALKTFRKIIDVDPEYKYAWNNMGNIHARMGDYGKAIDCYRKALTIDPNYDDALLNLGYVMIRTGSYDEALKLAEKIKAIS